MGFVVFSGFAFFQNSNGEFDTSGLILACISVCLSMGTSVLLFKSICSRRIPFGYGETIIYVDREKHSLGYWFIASLYGFTVLVGLFGIGIGLFGWLRQSP